MPTENNLPDGVRPNRKLPPEFQFLFNHPNFKEMDGNEVHEYMESYFARICEKAAVLREYGVDAEKFIAYFEPLFRDFEKAARDCDVAVEKQYQSAADLADARYNLFKAMDAIVTEACEKNPFDPEVQEMKEFVDEWRKQMPKE